jgi:L-alanine-DL-glutamate epimerase-like enolase superfamily enzyme
VKITGFRFETYLMKLDRPIADCNLPEGLDLLPGSVLFLETDADLTGIALGFGGDGIAPLFHLIEGEDPREVGHLWMKINDYIHKLGNEGAAHSALGAIDVALWDLKAKAAGEPLWRTLGARDNRVKAYASGLDYCLDDEELFSFYRRMAEQGIDGGKLKVGLDVNADMRRLGIVRDALSVSSDQPTLMIDSNEYWSPKQAVRYIRRMEQQFDIAWAEEPARRWDYLGLRLVSEQVKAAVATGENLNSVADFYPLMANAAVDVVNVAASHSGISGCRQIAHMANACGLPVAMMNSPANFMAHAAAAFPGHIGLEVLDCGREQCLQYDSYVEDGYVVLGNTPGLGIEVDEEALRSLQAQPPTGRGRFPFSRREGAARFIHPLAPGEVGWKHDNAP